MIYRKAFGWKPGGLKASHTHTHTHRYTHMQIHTDTHTHTSAPGTSLSQRPGSELRLEWIDRCERCTKERAADTEGPHSGPGE